MEIDKSIFRAYDVRGVYPDQINEGVAERVTLAFVKKLNPKTVAVGRDLREASEKMFNIVVETLIDQGIDVKDVGEITTPMMGFATYNYDFDAGICLTASHNPIGYGGLKMLNKGAITIPGDDEEILKYSLDGVGSGGGKKGKIEKFDIYDDYIKLILSIVDTSKLTNKKILFDPMYGSINLILDKILKGLPIEKVNLHNKADKKFGGLKEPNPYNYEVQKEALAMMKSKKPDFGVMWDGDGDRVFFIDEKGDFIEAPYITAVLTEYILINKPNSKIVCDTRVIWPIEKAVNRYGGELVETKSGYRFLKEKMAEIGSPFAAETTAHYFFEETKNMDNGMLPFLMVWSLLSEKKCTLSKLVAPYREGHFMMEEIKKEVDDVGAMLTKIKDKYKDFDNHEMDGLSILSDDFRFNIRSSNTEPVIKLNMEAKSQEVLEREKAKLVDLMNN